MGKTQEGSLKANFLLGAGPTLGWPKEEGIAMWHEKARGLLLKQTLAKFSVNSSSCSDSDDGSLPKVQAPAEERLLRFGVECSAGKGLNTTAPLAVPAGMLAEKCSWRSVGSLEDKNGDVNNVMLVCERLLVVVIWVRGALLVWDYGNDEVVSWIDVQETYWFSQLIDIPTNQPEAFEDQRRRMCSDESGHVAILVVGSHGGGTRLVNLDTLVTEKSEKSGGPPRDLEWEWGAFVGCATAHILDEDSTEVWFQCFNAATENMQCFDAMLDKDGHWRLVVGKQTDLSLAAYHGESAFRRDVAFLGPFALACNKPTVEMYGQFRVSMLVRIVSPHSPLVVSGCNGGVVKCFDVFGPDSVGECMFTISDYTTCMRKLCVTEHFIFCVPDRKSGYTRGYKTAAELTEDPSNHRDLGVWSMATGARVATLRHDIVASNGGQADNALSAAVTSTVVLPEQQLVVACFGANKMIYAWSFAKASECISNRRAVSSEGFEIRYCFHYAKYSADYSYSNLRQNRLDSGSLLLCDSTQLLAWRMSAPLTAGSTSTVTSSSSSSATRQLGPRAATLNCTYCGQWDANKTSKCSVCAAYFCDKSCLKKGWPVHKKVCGK